jgi:hypothetical protein
VLAVAAERFKGMNRIPGTSDTGSNRRISPSSIRLSSVGA